jgi:hypothetical protein
VRRTSSLPAAKSRRNALQRTPGLSQRAFSSGIATDAGIRVRMRAPVRPAAAARPSMRGRSLPSRPAAPPVGERRAAATCLAAGPPRAVRCRLLMQRITKAAPAAEAHILPPRIPILQAAQGTGCMCAASCTGGIAPRPTASAGAPVEDARELAFCACSLFRRVFGSTSSGVLCCVACPAPNRCGLAGTCSGPNRCPCRRKTL